MEFKGYVFGNRRTMAKAGPQDVFIYSELGNALRIVHFSEIKAGDRWNYVIPRPHLQPGDFSACDIKFYIAKFDAANIGGIWGVMNRANTEREDVKVKDADDGDQSLIDEKIIDIAKLIDQHVSGTPGVEVITGLKEAFELGRQTSSHSKGLRELSPEALALVNKIKSHGEATRNLCEEVNYFLADQWNAAGDAARLGNIKENIRLDAADPFKWASIAEEELQSGYMKLVRAVAQPESF